MIHLIFATASVVVAMAAVGALLRASLTMRRLGMPASSLSADHQVVDLGDRGPGVTPPVRRYRPRALVPLVAGLSVLAGVVAASIVLSPGGPRNGGEPAGASPAPSSSFSEPLVTRSLPVGPSDSFKLLYNPNRLSVTTDCNVRMGLDIRETGLRFVTQASDLEVRVDDCPNSGLPWRAPMALLYAGGGVFGGLIDSDDPTPEQCIEAIRADPSSADGWGADPGRKICLLTPERAGKRELILVKVLFREANVLTLSLSVWEVVN